MKTYSVLMFNFNDYEIFREPYEADPECEYIYVTDNKNFKSNIFKFIYDEKLKNKSPIYASMYVRYHPFEYVSTDICIVLDGSMQIKKSLNDIYTKFINSKKDILLSIMPFCGCKAYGEIDAWEKSQKRLNHDQAEKLRFIYAKENMQNYRGAIDAGIKIVKNDKKTEEIHNTIWNFLLFLKCSSDILRLDQVAASFILNKFYTSLNPFLVSRQAINSEYIQYMWHKTNKPCHDLGDYKNLYWNNKKIDINIL